MSEPTAKIIILNHIMNNYGEYNIFTPAEITRECGLYKQIVHNALTALTKADIIKQQAKGQYQLESMSRAVEYLIYSNQPKEYKNIDYMSLAFMNKGEKESLAKTIDSVVFIRSLDIPGHEKLTKRIVSKLRHNIDVLERAAAAASRQKYATPYALKRLHAHVDEAEVTVRQLAAELEPVLGMAPALFDEMIDRLDSSVDN
jgi:hypothetical protein